MQKLTELTKEELIELIVREREALSGWQPIESAPRDGTYIQIWRNPSDTPTITYPPIVIAKWDRSPFIDDSADDVYLWLFASDGDVFNDAGIRRNQEIIDGCDMFYYEGDGDFTHWQPLPTPPMEIK